MQTRGFMVAALGLMIGAISAAIYFFAGSAPAQSSVQAVDSRDGHLQFGGKNVEDNGYDAEVADPSYSPQDVVGLQLASLRKAIADPEQIRVCYSLASPENRELTGPLIRFAQLFRAQPYRPLLGHQASLIGKVRVRGDHADMMVSVIAEDGQTFAFQFLLSRQRPMGELDLANDASVLSESALPEESAVLDPDLRPIDESGKCWLTHSVFPVLVSKIVPTRTTEP